MAYLIDGHNLIGQLPDIRLDDPNDEALLVQKLAGFAARTGKRCIVVFDGGMPGGRSRMSTTQVEVVFSSAPGIADAIIMERIRTAKDPKAWIVVSNDNAVLRAAKMRGMDSIKSVQFAQKLRPPARKSRGKDGEVPTMDVYVSPREVEEWLKIFSAHRPPNGKVPPENKPTPQKIKRTKNNQRRKNGK